MARTEPKTWERREAKIAELALDPHNARLFATEEANPSPSDLLLELLTHEDVDEIAKSIVTNGIYVHEQPIVVNERVEGANRLVVVEGNRRLAALKFLLNPDLVPPARRKHYKELAKKAALKPDSKIWVVVAPTRSAATRMIVARHTHAQTKKWEPIAQANYFHRLREDGLSVEEIMEFANLSEAQVLEPLRAYVIYAAAQRLQLDEKTKELVEDRRNFPISTLLRVFESKDLRAALGVDFEGERVVGKVHPDEFAKGFKRVVTDIAAKRETSRTLSKIEDQKRYLAAMGRDRPDISRPGSFGIDRSGEIELPKTPARASKTVKSSSPPGSRARESKNVIPTSFRPKNAGARVQAICTELRSLKLDKYLNASALLLRSLIDISLTEYLEREGLTAASVQRADKHNKKGPGWSPTLRQGLNFLLESHAPAALKPQQLTAARKFAGQDADQGLCLDSLDKFTHNAYTPPSARELRSIWTHIEPLLRAITGQ